MFWASIGYLLASAFEFLEKSGLLYVLLAGILIVAMSAILW